MKISELTKAIEDNFSYKTDIHKDYSTMLRGHFTHEERSLDVELRPDFLDYWIIQFYYMMQSINGLIADNQIYDNNGYYLKKSNIKKQVSKTY
jgi:hypothetical protein